MRWVALSLLVILFVLPLSAKAQGYGYIRDTEIEQSMNEWFTPILRAAGLSTKSVNIILVNSPEVNAFVAGGNNVFIYTGLLMKTDSVGEVIGVFAHELGHVTGGHLIRTREAATRAQGAALVSTLVGFGAAILGGGDAAVAAMSTGQAFATSTYLAHSRIQESSADQAAISYIQDANLDPEGFRSFLGKLENQELLPASQQVEYVRTHPITRNRIENVSTRIERTASKDKPYPKEWQEQHRRMKAKLIGFINPDRVYNAYPEKDESMAARYARVIAAYKKNNFDRAHDIMDAMLLEEPQNPYFLELLGQIYRDEGKLDMAVENFEKAVKFSEDSAMIKMALAHVLLESSKDEDITREAIKYLKEAVILEPRTSFLYRLLATAYGRLGQDGQAQLYLAEEGVIRGDLDYARRQAEIAAKEVEPNSPEKIRAEDLLLYIKQEQAREMN